MIKQPKNGHSGHKLLSANLDGKAENDTNVAPHSENGSLDSVIRLPITGKERDGEPIQRCTQKFVIDKWPDEFAAVLLTGGLRCDESRREAVRRYIEASDDVAACERYRAEYAPEQAWDDCLTRMKRHRQRAELGLSDMAVDIETVNQGEPFDASRHECIHDQPTSDPGQANCIAAVQHPLFTWQNHRGTPQCVPAKVIVFRLESKAESSDVA